MRKISISVLKVVEDKNHFVRVIPSRELFIRLSSIEQNELLRDVNTIY